MSVSGIQRNKNKQTNYKTCGCLTEKKIDLYKNRKKQLGIIVYHIFMDEK